MARRPDRLLDRRNSRPWSATGASGGRSRRILQAKYVIPGGLTAQFARQSVSYTSHMRRLPRTHELHDARPSRPRPLGNARDTRRSGRIEQAVSATIVAATAVHLVVHPFVALVLGVVMIGFGVTVATGFMGVPAVLALLPHYGRIPVLPTVSATVVSWLRAMTPDPNRSTAEDITE